MRRHHVIFFLHTDNLMGNFRHGAQREFLTRKNAEYKPAGRAFLHDARHPRHKMPRTSRAGLYTMYIRIITVYIYGNRQNLRSAAR